MRSPLLLLASLLVAPTAAAQFALAGEVAVLDQPVSTRLLDVNGDGLQDVIIGGFRGAYWIENRGAGSFGDVQVIYDEYLEGRGVELADIDQDGDQDLYMAVGFNNIVVWIENLGGGSFGFPQTIARINRPFEVQASDLNGDGHLDMLVAGRGADRVAWYSGDGAGSFQFEANLSTDFNGASQVIPFDVDSDGDLDVIAGADIASRIVWHRNNGAGLFSAGIVITTEASNPTSLELADLDGDGRQDLLIGSLGDDQLGWHAGTSIGFSTSRNSIPTDSNGVLDAHAADIDYDGIPDVFVAAFVSGTVTWYRGLGAGAFGPEEVLGTAPLTGGARDVWAADLDSDGDRDVVACIQASDVILWYEFTEELGTPYCLAEPNSTGLPGRLAVTGSPNVVDNSVALNAEDLPFAQFGFFLTSTTQGFVANPGGSQGNLCLSGDIGRYTRAGEVQFTGGSGTMLLPIDLSDTPHPMGSVSVLVGETRNWQAWYRDSNPSPISNLTDGISVTWQ